MSHFRRLQLVLPQLQGVLGVLHVLEHSNLVLQELNLLALVLDRLCRVPCERLGDNGRRRLQGFGGRRGVQRVPARRRVGDEEPNNLPTLQGLLGEDGIRRVHGCRHIVRSRGGVVLVREVLQLCGSSVAKAFLLLVQVVAVLAADGSTT